MGNSFMESPIGAAGESVKPSFGSFGSFGVKDIFLQLCHKVQRDCDKVGGKPFMLIFRRPRRKWESLALEALKEFKAQLEDEEMMSAIQWIAEWEKPDDTNQSVYREYDRCYKNLLRLAHQISEDLDWMTSGKVIVVQEQKTAQCLESLERGRVGLKSTTAELRTILAAAN